MDRCMYLPLDILPLQWILSDTDLLRAFALHVGNDMATYVGYKCAVTVVICMFDTILE